VDLIRALPLVGLRAETFTEEQTALKVVSSKVVKHEKTCSDNEHDFVPFAFDSVGFISPEVVSILQKVHKILNITSSTSPRASHIRLQTNLTS
jgi:hypothetical protein